MNVISSYMSCSLYVMITLLYYNNIVEKIKISHEEILFCIILMLMYSFLIVLLSTGWMILIILRIFVQSLVRLVIMQSFSLYMLLLQEDLCTLDLGQPLEMLWV